MDSKKEYLYIRDSLAYERYNVYKVGITPDLIERDFYFRMGEIIAGKFVFVAEINRDDKKVIGNDIKKIFRHLNLKLNGGADFYSTSILKEIKSFLIENVIQHRVLSEDDISTLEVDYKNKNTYLDDDFVFKPKDNYVAEDL